MRKARAETALAREKALEERVAGHVDELARAKASAAQSAAATDGEARGRLERELRDALEAEHALQEQVNGLRAAMTRAPH